MQAKPLRPGARRSGRQGKPLTFPTFVMALIKDLDQTGQTIVMMTHDRETAAYAGRTVRLRDGCVER